MKLAGRKGQSYIIQFVLFFIIGIGLFIGIGTFYRSQYEIMRRDAADVSIEMINGYMSSLVVASVESCLHCASVENHVRLSGVTAGYFLELSLNESGLAVQTAPPERGHLSSMNNLNYSFDSLEGSAPSIETINLTYDRIQNKLEIK